MSWTPTVLTIDSLTATAGNTLTVLHYASFTGATPALGMRFSVNNNAIAYLDVYSSGLTTNMQGQVTAVNLIAQTVTVRCTQTGTGPVTDIGTSEPMVQGADLNPQASPPWSASPWILAYPYTPTTGNLLLAFTMTKDSNSATAVISDTGSHTWTLLQRQTGTLAAPGGTTYPSTFWLWSAVANGSASTVTVTSGTLAGDLLLYECQGPLTLDQSAAQFISAPASSEDPLLGVVVTPTQANELVIGFFVWTNLASSGDVTLGNPPWVAMGMGDTGSPQATAASVNYSATTGVQTPAILTLAGAFSPQWGTATVSFIRTGVSGFVPQVGAFFAGI